jgi:hypothetical protein
MSILLESLDHDRFVEAISAVNDAAAGVSWRALNSRPFDMDLSNDWLNNYSRVAGREKRPSQTASNR